MLILEIMMFLILYLLNFNYIMLSNFMFIFSLNLLIKLNWIDWSMLMLEFSLNYYNLMLIIMSMWIGSLIILNLKKINYLINLLLILIMIMNFLSLNLMMYYLIFEIGLLLIFYIIIMNGYSNDRFLASFYLMFYTMIFSLPMLFIMFMIYYYNYTFNFNMLELKFYLFMSLNMYLLMTFLVKIPMYLFHGWLLKAHVEAPFYSSMILAAIMLKLGSYGLLRMIMIFKNLYMYNIYFIIISLMGSIMLSFVCLMQIDMKILIALSSVIHMSVMMMSMFTYLKIGMLGSYLMMISHGFASSSLFYLINIIYNQSNSRLMFINKGMMKFMPSMSLMWFLMCSLNMAVPMTLNLVSEIFMIMSLISWMKFMFLFLMIYCIFSFLYSLNLFCYINHGSSNLLMNLNSGKLINFLILMLHWFPMNLMIFNLNYFF